MSAALPILLAGLGGAGIALALSELLSELPGFARRLDATVAALGQAGAEGSAPSETERRRIGVLMGVFFGLAAVLLLGPGPGALLAALGPVAAGRLIARRRRLYRRSLERQVPAIAGGMADALATGGSLRTALDDLAISLEGAAGAELRRVAGDMDLGLAPREALVGLAERLDSEQIERLVAAMLSQQRNGGDLAGLLRKHAEAAVQRERALAEARSATAQARLTGGMVVAMPVGAAVLIELAAPGFVGSMLGEPAAAVLLVAALGLQVAGYLLIQRLGRVR